MPPSTLRTSIPAPARPRPPLPTARPPGRCTRWSGRRADLGRPVGDRAPWPRGRPPGRGRPSHSSSSRTSRRKRPRLDEAAACRRIDVDHGGSGRRSPHHGTGGSGRPGRRTRRTASSAGQVHELDAHAVGVGAVEEVQSGAGQVERGAGGRHHRARPAPRWWRPRRRRRPPGARGGSGRAGSSAGRPPSPVVPGARKPSSSMVTPSRRSMRDSQLDPVHLHEGGELLARPGGTPPARSPRPSQ